MLQVHTLVSRLHASVKRLSNYSFWSFTFFHIVVFQTLYINDSMMKLAFDITAFFLAKTVVTCEYMKLFWNNFEIISAFYFTTAYVTASGTETKFVSAAERVLKLFQSYFFQRHWACWRKIFMSCNNPPQ